MDPSIALDNHLTTLPSSRSYLQQVKRTKKRTRRK
jgi:hypothetical protein